MELNEEMRALTEANEYKEVIAGGGEAGIMRFISNPATETSNRIGASLALAERGSGENRRAAVRELLEYVMSQHSNIPSFNDAPKRLLETSLGVLAGLDFKGMGDKALVDGVKEELRQWLEEGWNSPAAAVILTGLHKNPVIRYENSTLGNKPIKDILGGKGIDSRDIEYRLKESERAFLKKNICRGLWIQRKEEDSWIYQILLGRSGKSGSPRQ